MIGPIDPQVTGRDGRFLPLQALIVLVDEIRARGEEKLKKGEQPAWTDIQILRNLDAKELGDAYSASQYSIQLAAEYLYAYKLQHWHQRGNGTAVTDAMRKERARWIAEKLCSHNEWRAHSHGITRDIARTQLKLEINHPESVEGLHRAIRRLWALLYWTFDNSLVAKLFLSQHYSLFRTATAPAGGQR